MPSCVFKRCTNSSKTKNKFHGITFHSFPKDEPSRNKWLHVVRKQRQEADWLPTNSSRLCSVHFKPRDMYTTNKGYKKLHKRAYPYFLDTIPFRPPVIATSNLSTTTEDTDENELSPASDILEEEETDIVENESSSQTQNLKDTETDNLSLNRTDKITPTITPITQENHGKHRHEGFQCDNCSSDIIGFRYTCIQCNNFDLCTACESGGVHSRHYMLRVPSPRPYDEIQAVLVSIRKFLMGKLDFISTIEMDGGDDLVTVKTELNSDDMDEDIEELEEKVETIDEGVSNHDLIEQSTLFPDGFADLIHINATEVSQYDKVAQLQPNVLNEDKEIEGTFLVPILETTKSEIPIKLETKTEDTEPSPLIEISTQQGQIIISSTGKRKTETNRSESVHLEQSNPTGKKICVAPNTSAQELSKSSVISVRNPDTVTPLVKLLNAPPRSTLSTENPTASSQPSKTSSPQKPETISVDRKS